jgi:hypothetical protein
LAALPLAEGRQRGILFPAMTAARIAALFLLPALAACGPSATAGGFDSANPAGKLYAIEQAARTQDRAAIPRIIEQLASDDPAVRAVAIATLQKLTGETYGYRDYDPPSQRQAAIDRWIDALRADAIPVSPHASTIVPPGIGAGGAGHG